MAGHDQQEEVIQVKGADPVTLTVRQDHLRPDRVGVRLAESSWTGSGVVSSSHGGNGPQHHQRPLWE